MSSKPKTEIISNDTQTVSNIYTNMMNSAGNFSIEAFRGYITSYNVLDDTECNESYNGGVKATEKVAKEMKRTARFLKNIGAALIEIDCTAAKDNAK
jgi:hypothetical protein